MQLVENRFEIENSIVKDQYSDMEFDIIEVPDKYINAQFIPGFLPVYATYQENDSAYGIIQRQELIPYTAAINEKQIKKNFLPLLLGLKWLQEQNMVFGNLTPDKIYQIDNGYVLKDFGAGKYCEEKTPYTPYEYYAYHGCGNKASDVYSVCAIIYEALTGIILPKANERIDADALEPLAAFGVSSPFCDIIEKGLSVLDCDRHQSINDLITCIYTADEINACINDWSIFVRPIKSNLSDVKDKIAREKRIIEEEEKEEEIVLPQTIDSSKKKKMIITFIGICVIVITVMILNLTIFNKPQPEKIREIKMSPMPVSVSGSAISGSAVSGSAVSGGSVTITPTFSSAPIATPTVEPSSASTATATIKPTRKPTPKPTKKPKKKKKRPKATPVTIKTPRPRRTFKPIAPKSKTKPKSKPKIKIDKNISIE